MKSILLAEDDPFLIDIYRRRLEDSGFKVIAAKDGLAVLKKLQQGKFGLLILDIVLPNMDGWEILENIRKNAKLNNLKVIVLSNLGQESDVIKAKKLGVAKYLIKAHYTPSEVVKIIKEVLQTK
ncbi:response regulator [bacterium]|nr:response regulator [bacterium]